jgi:high affinity Mn2+ porin
LKVKAAVLNSAFVLVCACSGFAAAADTGFPVKAQSISSTYDWAGSYFGGHVGYGRGSASVTVWDIGSTHSTNAFGGLIGGVQLGHNFVLPSRVLLGLEADISFPNAIESNGIVAAVPTANGQVTEQMDYVGTARGRLGYLFDPWMIYGTGGFAWAGGRFLNDVGDDEQKKLHLRAGWVVGAGAEYAFAPGWTARLEYLHSRFASADILFASGTRYASTTDFQVLRVGLNRKIDWPGSNSSSTSAERAEAKSDSNSWELHAQTTYVQQGYPAFRSPYIGPNSLTPWPQTRNTWTNSAFIGVRLWEGGEVYYNPELLQGFGLHDTTGAGGFPNGEAQKSSFTYPHYNTSRLFVRQTIGLGGEQETLESVQNQLSDKLDVSRLTIQAGKFAVTDVFDGNSYAKDTRRDFLNWSIWAPGAFDYPADRLGLTYGAIAELNQKDWALRAGYFLMGRESNSDNFDMRLFERGEYVMEVETRYALFSRPGKLRTIGWLNSAFAGSYRETLDNPSLNLDISQTRRGRIKYGYVVNVEQSVTDDIGLFGRWSWNDGKNEIMAFTDIDASLSLGASIKGKAWGRPDDTVGIAGVINALSKDHRDFIAAGGLGILIGDGQLNYQQEKIIESYYAFAVNKMWTLTLDYQLIVNPAYNADRGPVSVFAGRVHAEF